MLSHVPKGGAATLRALRPAAAAAQRAGAGRTGREIVREARPIVQRKAGERMTQGGAKPFADADHLLLTGRYGGGAQAGAGVRGRLSPRGPSCGSVRRPLGGGFG